METEKENKVARRRSWAEEEEEEEDIQGHKRRMVDLVWIAGAVNQEEEEEAPEAEWEEDEDWLDPVLLEKGIKDEVDFMEKIGLFKEASEKESWEKTGAAPVSTRWVSVKKTLDGGEVIVRSRLVGRDFKSKGDNMREDLFAATPPLEALKLLFRMSLVKLVTDRDEDEIKLMFVDVRKAHLIPKCDEDVYVTVPEEFGIKKVMKLNRWLYGMRKAAHYCEEFYTKKFVEKGFVARVASPVVFFDPQTRVRCVVHGDDFTFAGKGKELVELRRWMETWCEIKFRGIMGSGPRDIKVLDILGRRLRRTKDGLEYRADAKHRKIILKEMGMDESSNAVVSPLVKEEP